jgi:hypothetical protein
MLIRIFSDLHFMDCDTLTLKKVGPGKYEGLINGDRAFTAVGGRHSGGASNEWFLHCPDVYGEQWLPLKSLVACVKAAVYA